MNILFISYTLLVKFLWCMNHVVKHAPPGADRMTAMNRAEIAAVVMTS